MAREQVPMEQGPFPEPQLIASPQPGARPTAAGGRTHSRTLARWRMLTTLADDWAREGFTLGNDLVPTPASGETSRNRLLFFKSKLLSGWLLDSSLVSSLDNPQVSSVR